jgi:hypothetical protein
MPGTDWKEEIEDGEAARFESYAAFLSKGQRAHASNGAVARALHAKQNLGVEAELVIGDDVPADAKLAMFATPKRYRPLGNIMRARNVAYRSSTQARKTIAEPREAPTFE